MAYLGTEIDMELDSFLLLYMLLRPVLFCTLYLDAFRDRLRLSLPVFLGGLAALQLLQAAVIDMAAGYVDFALCLYLTAAVNIAYYKLAGDVAWDRLLMCVLLVSPTVSLVQSAGLMAYDRLEGGFSAHLVNLLVMLAVKLLILAGVMLGAAPLWAAVLLDGCASVFQTARCAGAFRAVPALIAETQK